MNLLSLIRLGVDLAVFPESCRPVIDRLFIEAQPGHLQHALKAPCEPGERDLLRANRLRAEFAGLSRPEFKAPDAGAN